MRQYPKTRTTDRIPVPGQWIECTAMVPGTWRQYFFLLQVAAESVCHGTGTAGDSVR